MKKHKYYFSNLIINKYNVNKDITIYHYINQPKSMLSGKLIINLLQNQSGYCTH